MSYAASNRCLARCPRKLLDQLPLPRREVLGQSDVNFGLQVSAAVGLAQVGHALTAQSEKLAILSTGRDLKRQTLASGRWHVDLAA
jgi:hypothetical protein